MSELNHAATECTSLQGHETHFQNESEKIKALDDAFDYRGDVTLLLTSGESLEGFVANRDRHARPPIVQLFAKGEDRPRTLPYAEIQGLVFSGRDTADGKSYEAWKSKKEVERKAEAEKVEAEMREKGYL